MAQPDYSLQRAFAARFAVAAFVELSRGAEGLRSLPPGRQQLGRARMWAGLSPGAGAAFTELPSLPGQQLMAPVFRAALNSFLVLEVPGVDGGVLSGCPHRGCVETPQSVPGGLVSLHAPVCNRANRHVVHDRLLAERADARQQHVARDDAAQHRHHGHRRQQPDGHDGRQHAC